MISYKASTANVSKEKKKIYAPNVKTFKMCFRRKTYMGLYAALTSRVQPTVLKG